ncbi:hypothetical protein BYT27DRAFT_7181160 [Phlegmacium glaucopus]|nr:hypothetical protein BYT27DRAFT_7181160 [Phlegmacium glaucopus]
MVRSAITSTSNTDVQSGLWISSPINPQSCSLGIRHYSSGSIEAQSCASTLGNIPWLPEPFLAQLPSGYNTGLIRQILPRINSSATRETITEADFPANCDTLPGSFYVNYANARPFGNWSLIACMPANQTQSPWKPVRTRQDFSEELYLNLSVSGFKIGSIGPRPDKAKVKHGLFKITVNTTAGYFELPNYMIGQSPGPLLDDDPSNFCSLDCIPQGFYPDPRHLTSRSSLTRRDNTNGTNIISNTSLALEISTNRGPLLTTAIALFGEGSFIADRLTHPEAYINRDNISDIFYGKCIGQAPLIGLLHDSSGEVQYWNVLDPCIRTNINDASLQLQIAMYVSSLYDNQYGGDRIRSAFESAAFLANEAWLQSSTLAPSFSVSYDAGADMVVPAISPAGILLISVLLAVDLLSLLAMALYSAWTPCWTDQLDAFAMMRIGAAIAESIPFRVANTTDRIKILDETPGWVGDTTEGKGKVGELGIGAPTPLRRRRKYACY